MATRKIKTPEKKRRVRVGKLDTAWDVAKYIQKCLRLSTKGEGEGTEMYRRVMMASMLLKAIETASLERRLSELEKRVGDK